MRLVECVPNFSEGRDREKIQAIVREIESVAGVKLLDVDPGASTNRTVVTFLGEPEPVVEAAFRAVRKAAEVIDMRTHRGAHSRIGATDVCPLVPVAGVTMEDCVRWARALGRRVGEELGIPVYLYEAAASRPERRNLAAIRAGEYEGLAEKLKDPVWAPDFGAAVFNPRSGATVIGAREFLIAYNIDLNTRDRKLAHEIALDLRESGRARRDKAGNILRDKKGNALKVPGRFKEVKAVGWYVEDYGRAQISVNFTNYKVTPPHVVFDAARRLAAKRGLRVTGSELVGLIPKDALLAAGRHYLEQQGKSAGFPEEELIRIAVLSLGLDDVAPFDAKKKIIEAQMEAAGGSLAALPVREFANAVSMDSPAPGGGSVAALCGALSAALSAMVANLTVGKKGYEPSFAELDAAARRAQELKDNLLRLVDDDTLAFNRVMDAFRLPKATEEQAREREAAVQEATRGATLVPLEVLRHGVALLKLAMTVAVKGNRNSMSDAGVAAAAARAAAQGAFYNVRTNLAGLGEGAFKASAASESERLIGRVERLAGEVDRLMRRSLGR